MTTLKEKFTSMAEEILIEAGPLEAANINERVKTMARHKNVAVRDLSSITNRQVATILKQDKRFKRVRTVGHVRIALWAVRDLGEAN